MERDNLTVITHAHVRRVLLEGEGDDLTATGIEYHDADGAISTVTVAKEVILSAGAIGSPQLLLSGVGPREELAAVGVDCVLDLPDVGKHLKDHLHTAMIFPAPRVGVTMTEVAISLGSDALRHPSGRCPPIRPTTRPCRRSWPV